MWGQPPSAVQPSEARQLPKREGHDFKFLACPELSRRVPTSPHSKLSSRAKRNDPPRGSFRAVEGPAFPCRPSPAPGRRRDLFPLRLLISTHCHPSMKTGVRVHRYLFAALRTGFYSCSKAHKVCRSEEHTSELQSHHDLVCRLLLEK